MNYCMWTEFCISEEGYKFKRILANHQIYKAQTISKTVQARLQDLKKQWRSFYWISL